MLGRGAVLVALVFVGSCRALANDSTAELATGGLVFTKNDFLQMRSEELFISMQEIRVRYVFFNTSRNDVTTLVAFPMPDIDLAGDDRDVAIPSSDPQNLLDFSTVIDGRTVKAQVEQRALVSGIDRTDILQKLGIPVAEPTNALIVLPRSEWDQLQRAGLTRIEDVGAVQGIKEELRPQWTVKTTFFWQQVFPAQRDLKIDHRYTPSVGSVVPMSEGQLRNNLSAAGFDRYCIDRPFLRILSEKSRTPGAQWLQQNLQYILKTGANWAGPIKHFRMVVDKGSPENLVSFCGKGIKKISATEFEVYHQDFVPTSNLHVIFFSPSRPDPAESRETISPLGVPPNVDEVLANLRRAQRPYTCSDLSYFRNAIFKSAGYCFKTSSAIREFGNAGCSYENASDLPLSQRQRSAVQELVAAERNMGCR
jgi:hypothetical protein